MLAYNLILSWRAALPLDDVARRALKDHFDEQVLLRRTDVARYLDGLLMLGGLREVFRVDALGRSVAP